MVEDNPAARPVQGIGELGVRVGLLERRDIDIEKQVNAIRDTMATRADIAGLSHQIQSLMVSQQQANKTNYPLLGLIVVVMGMLGGFAYWPINTSIGDLKVETALISENSVRTQRYNQDQDRLTHILDGVSARQLRDEEKFVTTNDFTVQHQDLKDMTNRIDARLTWLEHHATTK